MDGDLNVCKAITDSMERFGFERKNIDAVANNAEVIQAVDKPATLQKTVLTMLFFNILISGNNPAPAPHKAA